MAKNSEGPFLAAAFLCQVVIEGKDGVLSAIRIVDRVTHTIMGPAAPETMPSFTYTAKLLLAFKSGAARGKHKVQLSVEAPSGAPTGQTISFPALFEGEDRGANFILDFALTPKEEGLYWLDVLLDDKRVTRVPLRIVYQRLETGGAPQGAGS